MIRATDLAHLLLRQSLKAGDRVVDATVGNGRDTLFLAECVGPAGRVLGFDIQEAALVEAQRRVGHLSHVTLIHAGHETLAEHLGEQEQLAAVMFNLGYLPGGLKGIMTRPATTLAGLGQAMARLGLGGLVTLVLYPGHPGGEEEAEALRSFLQDQPQIFAISRYARIDTLRPAPELFVIERQG